MKKGFRNLLILLLVLCLLSASACSSVSDMIDSVTGNGSGGTTAAMENGSTFFIPGQEDIARDEATGLSYIKGVILVYLAGDPDEEVQKKLSEAAEGKIVGVQGGTVPMLEIRTKAEDYAALRAIADRIAGLPEVIFADPEPVFGAEAQAINTVRSDPTPWSADNNTIEDKGNEAFPGGNDWWAEAIRAYSAWDALPELANPIPAGVIDDGIDTEHPEFQNRLVTVKKNTLEKDSYHGTFVTGIIGADGSNLHGIRGIADQSEIYFADHTNTYSGAFYRDDTTAAVFRFMETPAGIAGYYSAMHSKGVRVINHSFGNTDMLTLDAFNHLEKLPEKNSSQKNVKIIAGKYDTYDDYLKHMEYTAENSAEFLLRYMMIEYAKGNEDCIYVQSAGNGSYYYGTPISADLNLYFSSITESLFDSTLTILKNAYQGDPEISGRLADLKWSDIRDRIIIVGGASEIQISDDEYAPYDSSNAGAAVDICAPAENIFGLNNSTVSVNESCVAEDGTSCAAPMVTGSATLLWSAFPEFPVSEIKKILTECTDKKVTDAFGEEHPMLNIGQAVEYSLYYTFVRDQMIPKYGLQKGAQDGEKHSADENWLRPEGIVTAWIGNLDGERGDEMAVFRFEADMGANYYERPYYLMIDLFTIYNGVVQIQDTLNTGFALRRDYGYDLDLTVSAGTRDENRISDILISFTRDEEDLYGSREEAGWTVVCNRDGKLSRQEGQNSSYQREKRIFNMTNKGSRDERCVDRYEFRVTDSCRLTWYLDFVFTDRSYTPDGFVRDYDVSDIGVTDGLWSNPPKTDDQPRLIRTEDYENGELQSYHQFAYDENGLLIYDGYFHRDGELSSVIRYEYDGAGYLIRESEVLSSGKEDNVLCYVNDENGRAVRRDRFPEGGGKVTDWDEYEYDEAGNQTVWRGYRNEKYNFCWYYTYDSDGNRLTTERYDEDNYRTLSSKYEYDGAGHVLYTYGLSDENNYEVEATYQWSDNFHTRKSPWYHSNNGALAGYDTYTFDDYGNVLSFYTQSVDEDTPSRQRLYYYD